MRNSHSQDDIILEIGLANNTDIQLFTMKMIPEDQVRRTRIEGLIDTGANHLVLPASIAAFLGVPSAGDASVQYADGRTARREMVQQVELELLGRRGRFARCWSRIGRRR